MPYTLHDVSITCFDVHTSIDALTDTPNRFSESYRSLVDSTNYHTIHIGNRTSPQDAYTFQLPSNRSMTTHFWQAYTGSKTEGVQTIDYWKLQIPYMMRDRLKIELAHQEFGWGKDSVRDIRIQRVTYVNTVGWSTNIEIRIRCNSTPLQLTRLMAGLRGLSDVKPFIVQGKRAGLSEVFRLSADLVAQRVFSPNAKPQKSIEVPRRFLVSLNAYTGSRLVAHNMSPAELGRVRGMLLGKEIKADDELDIQQQLPDKGLLSIRSPFNFAINDQHSGLLVFLQRNAHRDDPGNFREGAVHCYYNNLRAFMIMTELFAGFSRRWWNASKDTDTYIPRFADLIDSLLKRNHAFYISPLNRRLMKKLWSADRPWRYLR